jgi:dCMP deaminase
MARPPWDLHFMNIAKEVAKMGTCFRRKVGCVLVNDRNVILSTGMNGVPPGWAHCSDNEHARCTGALASSGTRLDECVANHAEINALIHCPDPREAVTCYTTTSPCISCVKALLCTGVRRIVFSDNYSQQGAMDLWTRQHTRVGATTYRRSWEQILDDRNIQILATSKL